MERAVPWRNPRLSGKTRPLQIPRPSLILLAMRHNRTATHVHSSRLPTKNPENIIKSHHCFVTHWLSMVKMMAIRSRTSLTPHQTSPNLITRASLAQPPRPSRLPSDQASTGRNIGCRETNARIRFDWLSSRLRKPTRLNCSRFSAPGRCPIADSNFGRPPRKA